MGLEWQANIETKPRDPAMDALFDSYRQETGFPAPETLDGSTDESMDRDILVDATPLPVPLSGGCCDGGRCQPKPETRVYQAKCEDAAHPQTTHFERLDAMPFTPGLLCEQAARIVSGERQKKYGSAEMNFDRIALLWEAYDCAVATMPDGHVPATVQVAQKMILVKMARTIETPDHTDSWRDIAGYSDCGARCAGADPAK